MPIVCWLLKNYYENQNTKKITTTINNNANNTNNNNNNNELFKVNKCCSGKCSFRWN